MATTFPTTLQDLDATRGTATQPLNNPSHVTHHALEDDTLEALQTKVGIDSSAVTTSLDYLIKSTSGGHDHDGTDSKKVIATNLDVTGLTALGLLRVNTGGTAVESSGVAVSDLLTASATSTLTNKSLSDSTTSIVDVSDATKIVKFDVAGTTGVTGTIATAFTTTKTVTLPDATDTLVAKATTDTLTNKRVTIRTGTTTSHATPTINTDNVSFYSITAQTEAITSFTTNLSGTPTENQTLWIAITGTAARAITWGASFEASTVALPTTTVTTARLDVGFVWNTVTSKWRCVASA